MRLALRSSRSRQRRPQSERGGCSIPLPDSESSRSAGVARSPAASTEYWMQLWPRSSRSSRGSAASCSSPRQSGICVSRLRARSSDVSAGHAARRRSGDASTADSRLHERSSVVSAGKSASSAGGTSVKQFLESESSRSPASGRSSERSSRYNSFDERSRWRICAGPPSSASKSSSRRPSVARPRSLRSTIPLGAKRAQVALQAVEERRVLRLPPLCERRYRPTPPRRLCRPFPRVGRPNPRPSRPSCCSPRPSAISKIQRTRSRALLVSALQPRFPTHVRKNGPPLPPRKPRHSLIANLPPPATLPSAILRGRV